MKKFLILLASAVAVSMVFVPGVFAQASVEALLTAIKQDTGNILQRLDNFPSYIEEIALQAKNMNYTDTTMNSTTTITADLENNFGNLGSLLNSLTASQKSLQQQLNTDLLGTEANPSSLTDANDIVYSTLLGMPFYAKDPRNPPGRTVVNPPYNYIKNAAGFNIQHFMPGGGQGKPVDRQKYKNYYNTVMAIESFNGYVLSKQYLDAQNGNSFSDTQTQLITLASNKDKGGWFVQIFGEPMGLVIRQLLMFQSQAYILLTEILTVQKQLLAAQAMTNSLLILNNANNEKLLLSNAQGVPPSP